MCVYMYVCIGSVSTRVTNAHVHKCIYMLSFTYVYTCVSICHHIAYMFHAIFICISSLFTRAYRFINYMCIGSSQICLYTALPCNSNKMKGGKDHFTNCTVIGFIDKSAIVLHGKRLGYKYNSSKCVS